MSGPKEEKQVHTFIATVIVSICTSGFLVKSTSFLHVAFLQVSDFVIVSNYKYPYVMLEISNSPKYVQNVDLYAVFEGVNWL